MAAICWAVLSWAAHHAQAQNVETLISSGLMEPYGVAVDARNRYYVTDSANNRIVEYNPATRSLTNFAGLPGAEPGASDGRGVFARFYSPQGIVAVPARRAMVVADSGNHRLRLVTFDGEVRTLAGSVRGFQDGPALTAQFKAPASLAADSAGNIYVADLQNHAVRRLATNDVVTTLATNLLRPAAVALGGDGRLYVADTANHSIRVIPDLAQTNQTAALIAGSGSRVLFGYWNSLYGTEAMFDNPNSLLWMGGNIGLLVGDSGNHVLRRVFYNDALKAFSVETFPPSAGIGLDNPTGLARDLMENLVVVDLGNDNVRRIPGVLTPLPPVSEPLIGYILLVKQDLWVGTQLYAVTNALFRNDAVIGILGEPGTRTFYTLGPSDAAEGVPDPTPSSSVAPAYADNQPTLPKSLIDPLQPDVIIKAQSTHPDRRPSAVVAARIRFEVAAPVIYGLDPAAFTMDTETQEAQLWYTVDGTNPEPNPALSKRYIQGDKLNLLTGPAELTFKVRGFKAGYAPSLIIQRTVVNQSFVITNLQMSAIGVEEDSRGAPGSTVVLPLELKLAENNVFQTLQFRVEVQAEKGAPLLSAPPRVLAPTGKDFIPVSTPLVKPTYLSYYTNGLTVGAGVAYLGTNASSRITSSGPIALLAVTIPTNATVGQRYTVAVLEPSGTPDGLQNALLLNPMGNRTLLVTNLSYLVGDTAVAQWYNCGSFGDGLLSNNDVNNAFYASLGVRTPFAFTDVFDAMDAFPLDSAVAAGGDGQIRYLDWQIVLERSLRLRTDNWLRQRGAGGLRTAVSLTRTGSRALQPATEAPPLSAAWNCQVKVSAGTVENVPPGGSVRVPIWIEVAPGAALAGFQCWPIIALQPDAVESEVAAVFEANAGAGIPTPAQSACPGYSASNVAYVWDRGQFSPPLSGSNLIGWLSFQAPALAPQGACYCIRFRNADGAPLQDVQYSFETVPGAVWVNTSAGQPPTRISDEWKLHYFGSATADIAQDQADADGDGLSNLAEYALKADPTKPDWQVSVGRQNGGIVLRWYAEKGKAYRLYASSDLKNWAPLGEPLSGNDQVLEYVGISPRQGAQFYRVQILP